MKVNGKKLWLSAGLVIVVCSAIVVVFIISGDDVTPIESESEYPVLEPNEKLYDFSAHWYRYPDRKLVFEFDGPFPKMPDKMLVYRIIRPKNVTEAYVRELAERYFDMPTDAKLTRSSPRPGGSALYWLKTQAHLFEFDPDTGFFNILKYRKAREKLSEDRKDYPGDEECRRIATAYLKKRGLLPEDTYLSNVSGVNIESVGAISVCFGRMIGKYKCWGPGSEILVWVGVDGEITNVSIRWVEYEPYKLAPIKTAKEAFEYLKHGNAFIAGSGKVTRIALAYHSPAEGEYIQPMYNFAFTRPGAVASAPAIRTEYLKSKEEMWKEDEEERRRRRRKQSP
jgi:hypothetical protein